MTGFIGENNMDQKATQLILDAAEQELRRRRLKEPGSGVGPGFGISGALTMFQLVRLSHPAEAYRMATHILLGVSE